MRHLSHNRGCGLTLACTCYFTILDRTQGEGGTPWLVCPLIAIELLNKDEWKVPDVESNDNRFYYLGSHFDLPRAGQTKLLLFGFINVFANNF